jgi:hypothetical protein
MTKITREPTGEMPDDSASRYGHSPLHTSYDQGLLEIQGWLRANMLDPAAACTAQEVEAQAVVRCVHLGHQPGAQQHPLIRRRLDFENRELHALPIILTGPGDAAQAPGAALRGHRYIIADQNQHLLPSDQRRIGVEVAAQGAGEKARLQMRQQPERRTLLEKGMLDLLALAFLPRRQNRFATRLLQ